jgi:hypothetical protein
MRKTAVLLGLSLLLIISIVFAAVEYCNVLSLKSEMLSLQSEISESDSKIRERDSATVDRDTVITWLDTALHLAESRTNIELPNASKYLVTLPDQNGEEKTTKIFLNSTAAGYHYLPTTEFTTDLFKVRGNANSSRGILELTQNRSIVLSRWGWTFDAGGLSAGAYEYQIGTYAQNPVLIIGVTIRSDYTSADLGEAVGNRTGNYLSSINLAVRLYSQNGSVIEASVKENVWSSSRTAVGGLPFLFGAGQSKQVVFYLSPSSIDIDHYEIYVSSLSAY